ncbi:MAG: bifunctional tetrahydrofolate synthase/dihydrofolate synthase [Gammaproteobacteria bacterium]|nr:bifunctional tetrahydrofolate synthase/dihydrofolate synthase [Gammaproteobacteria bacterium]MCP5424802.1 bifunctional tetrahydrofolate synthase/dihydrofolate synthase [Gammaproteobacteria bacterium]MCP5458221.1 bifunctional tetrahydrofolate synthase/dihydrofolate synthase [Gammaproteobacteria bacterium]
MTRHFDTLAQWLTWQESLHFKIIDLGLERVGAIARRLELEQPPYRSISVGGTNGKGSCVAFLGAILQTAGYRVGVYTSPHLLRYNERIVVDGQAVSDAMLCQAFAEIDAARGDVSLTYFEFGTLAALQIFKTLRVDIAILEVGLGGRLDAVNIVDTDAALVTAIGIDHTEYLGADRASIGFEKAGIYRADRPAVCADPDPPASLLEYATAIGARILRIHQDYHFECYEDHWNWRHRQFFLQNLPLPRLSGTHQIGNAAAVLMILTALGPNLPVSRHAIATGLQRANIPGRFQIVSGPVEWILDVAHNAHAATVLAQGLRERPCAGHTHIVIGMLADKDALALAGVLNGVADLWYPATLPGSRGRSGEQLAQTLRTVAGPKVTGTHPSITDACRNAAGQAQPGDRIVVCGSFYAVAEILQNSVIESLSISTAAGG